MELIMQLSPSSYNFHLLSSKYYSQYFARKCPNSIFFPYSDAFSKKLLAC
jgi:hypothetical protein